jgi:hypothetical protein
MSLIAHTSAGAPDVVADPVTNPVTTDPIDTTGASLLVVYVADRYGTAPLTDSYGNAWVAGPAQVAHASSIDGDLGAVRLHYCIGGTGGTGHTFTADGVGTAVAVMAFDDPVSAVLDRETGNHSTEDSATISTGSITPSQNGALIVTGYADRMALGGGKTVFGAFSPATELLSAVATRHYTVGAAYFQQSTRAAISATWQSNTVFPAGQACVIAAFRTSSGGPIEYEDPCSITDPRVYMKVTTETETFKMSVAPLRESAAKGGFGVPRLIGLSPITKSASDPFTGGLSAQTATMRNADTDRVLREASATRTSFRGCTSEVYLTSKAQSVAELPPRALLAGVVHANSHDENLVQGFDINDPIGAGYSVTGEYVKLIRRRIPLIHFPNCPAANVGKPEQFGK